MGWRTRRRRSTLTVTPVSSASSSWPMAPSTAAHAYDAVKMIALAISQAGVDPHELRFYLNSMNPYDGVTGSTDFDDNGDVRKFHTMFGIEGGAAIRLEN